MNEPTLTDTQRARLFAAIERIVAVRVAEAVEQERAAWATKIETLAGRWDITGDPDMRFRFVDDLHGILAADDTEAKAPRIDTIKYRGKA